MFSSEAEYMKFYCIHLFSDYFCKPLTEGQTDVWSHSLIQTGEENWCNKMAKAWFQVVLCPRRAQSTVTKGPGLESNCWRWKQALPPMRCVTPFSKWLSFSGPQFPHLQMGIIKVSDRMVLEVKWNNSCKALRSVKNAFWLMLFVSHLPRLLVLLFNCRQRKTDRELSWTRQNACLAKIFDLQSAVDGDFTSMLRFWLSFAKVGMILFVIRLLPKYLLGYINRRGKMYSFCFVLFCFAFFLALQLDMLKWRWVHWGNLRYTVAVTWPTVTGGWLGMCWGVGVGQGLVQANTEAQSPRSMMSVLYQISMSIIFYRKWNDGVFKIRNRAG